ncbi:hypothetical protein [Nitrospira lenta]|uniref:hypothetical protein n=1 Tax=Nitrospira lenta TaxID=1436998 RepID=UPI0011B45315|nr:hypothetical protein [Nitrospira lenta]
MQQQPLAPLVILGSGYTARFLWPLVADRAPNVFATSRAPEQHLSHIPTAQRLRFDLSQPDTWANIPREADLLWCFPATPLNLVQQFAASLRGLDRRMVLLGSTSAYTQGDAQEYPPPWIDETAPIDLRQPRVQGEEYLRQEHGAVVLRVAGIYGPGRHPLDWIRTGRVGPTRKYVNLIQVEDLAAICLAAVERGNPGEAYNVSDGQPRTWKDICETMMGPVARSPADTTAQTEAGKETGKRIDSTKLLRDLELRLTHADLFRSLRELASPDR